MCAAFPYWQAKAEGSTNWLPLHTDAQQGDAIAARSAVAPSRRRRGSCAAAASRWWPAQQLQSCASAMLYTSLGGVFIISAAQLENSPSRQDGVSEEVERQLRLYGCEIIQEGGYLLKLPQVVVATGQVLFHRFFCKSSMVKFKVKVSFWAVCLQEGPFPVSLCVAASPALMSWPSPYRASSQPSTQALRAACAVRCVGLLLAGDQAGGDSQAGRGSSQRLQSHRSTA